MHDGTRFFGQRPRTARFHDAFIMSLSAYKVAISRRVKLILGAKYARLVRNSWDLDLQGAEEYQTAQFAALYRVARSLVPYYHERPSSYPPLALDRYPLHDALASLPVLTKTELRSANDQFWQRPLPPLTTFHTTSGSTGTAITLAATPFERGHLNLLIQQWISRITGKLLPRTLHLTAFFSPRRPALFHKAPALGSAHLSIYKITPRNRDAIIQELRSFRPELIWGYPSAIAALARLTEGTIRIPWCITTSEALLPEWREDIENLLSSRTYDFYSSQEGAHAAFQCKHGDMHVHPAAGIVEILDPAGRPCAIGQPGRVVVTGLVRQTMPLIRFDLGDVAAWKPRTCDCGSFPYVLDAIHGRIEDQIRTRDGAAVPMLGSRIFRSSPDIQEGQLIQHSLREFEVKLILCDPQTTPIDRIERRIVQLLKDRIGDPSITIRFDYPKAIARSANGKFRAVRVLC